MNYKFYTKYVKIAIKFTIIKKKIEIYILYYKNIFDIVFQIINK